MRFRPCIDLRAGRVVQIVGGTLSDADAASVSTNFETDRPPSAFASLYREDGLEGGHVIALGPGNDEPARAALAAYPGGMQYGGGVNLENAASYLEAGASHVIVTSFVFRDGRIDFERLAALSSRIGRERLTLDLSCRWRDGAYWVVTDRWQRFTETKVDAASLDRLGGFCGEFLVHGVDVEGRMGGIEERLVSLLGDASPNPVTYAGGARSFEDLEAVRALGRGRVDLTIGSALDIFGGSVSYRRVVEWDRAQRP